MRRGEIWAVADGASYAGKPRPTVIVQDNSFDATDSITICAFTSSARDAPFFRIEILPTERNGLRSVSNLMVDKIMTVPKSKLGRHIGRLDAEDMVRLNRAMLVFLGLAASPRSGATQQATLP